LTFSLRLLTGVVVYLALPVDGYDEPDDRAGFFFTDAHRRDDQAWELAQSDEPILSAFNKTYHTDQYGGLLAFTSLAYRVLSPDTHRPILLILLSAIVAALGMPFFWRAARLAFGEQVALVAGWILVFYPESLLLGGAAMREPYLITFGAMSFWGFVDWQFNHSHRAFTSLSGMAWLGFGLVGMLLVSPVVALITLATLAGWWWMAREHGRLSWVSFFAVALILVVGLALLAWALNRQGNFGGGPLGVIGEWFREVVKWDMYQLERGSGWVQKLFAEMPKWLRLPFVTVYGTFQPVLPAAFIEPTTLTWHIIGIVRALGWYLFWPLLLYALIAAWKNDKPRKRHLWLWITVISWFWITLTALRGGGDQWDNPRYRAILLIWQALAAAYAWTRFRLRSDSWLVRIWLVEVIFLAFFTQWYLNRYFHIGRQIPFGWMIVLIIGSCLIILVGGGLWDRSRHRKLGA
jgi:4-amino-4-deoxy-L-arabinose transferase-like glycosyltransferase